jgi:hypothetical protein
MSRPRALIAVAFALVALALTFAACGGDDEKATTNPAPSEPPSKGTTSPGTGGLPPQLVKCYADKGYEVDSPTDIHSAPPQVVQECFAALHQGGPP